MIANHDKGKTGEIRHKTIMSSKQDLRMVFERMNVKCHWAFEVLTDTMH